MVSGRWTPSVFFDPITAGVPEFDKLVVTKGYQDPPIEEWPGNPVGMEEIEPAASGDPCDWFHPCRPSPALPLTDIHHPVPLGCVSGSHHTTDDKYTVVAERRPRKADTIRPSPAPVPERHRSGAADRLGMKEA